MEFSWTKEQRALKRAAAEFASGKLNSDLAEREERREPSLDGWQECAAYGIQGIAMPERYGGSSQDLLTVTLLLEGLGRGCRDNGLLFALGAQIWSVQVPVLVHGTEQQRQRYLPGLIAAEIIGAHTATEPEAGSDIFSLRTTATRDEDCYILKGSKTFITNAPIADLFLVLATVDRSHGIGGMTAFLVDRDTPGLYTSRPLQTMGLRTAPLGEVIFEDCRVPASQMLGRMGGGSAVFKTAMEWERIFILAPALGTMERQLEQCIDYAGQRRQFGKPIGANQAIASMLVNMHRRLESARLLMYQAAWMKSVEELITWEPSLVKLAISESWVENSLDAVQIHGGAGYAVETGLERDVRDSIASKIYSGTSQMQETIIAALLGA
jgi:alkylation response protein AidB-like acyl-CoA dehydrogenase